MAEQEYKVFDLIQYVEQGKPLEFERAFGAIVREKLAGAVDEKTREVADTFFGGTKIPDDPTPERFAIDTSVDRFTIEPPENYEDEESEDGEENA